MKCKVFKIHLENDFDEAKLNEFLENAAVNQVFASIVSNENSFWSVLVLYEDKTVSPPKNPPRAEAVETPYTPNTFAPVPTKSAAPKREIAPAALAPEPVKLTAEQEYSYNALRNWLKPHEREKSSIGFIATALQSDAPPFACSGRYE